MQEKLIWEYQDLLHKNLTNYIQKLYGRISSDLKPEIIFLSIKENTHNDIYKTIDNSSINLYPQPDYINLELIKKIFIYANQLFNSTRKEDQIISNKEPYRYNPENYMEKCIHKSIKELLYDTYKDSNTTLFVSYPIKIKNYFNFALIKFKTNEYKKYNSINDNHLNSLISKKKLYRSYIETLTDVLLDEILEVLYKVQSNIYFDNIRTDINQLLRKAGELFVNKTIPNIISENQEDNTNEKLFEFCNYISSLNYEGKKNTSNLIFSYKDNPNLNKIIEFKVPIAITDYRNVRKLLEVSNDDFYMYSDTNFIYGIAKLKDTTLNDKTMFIVNFYDTYKWELLYEKKRLINVEYSFPFIREKDLEKRTFLRTYNYIFQNNNVKSIELIWTYINKLIDERKGTILLISSRAQQEANRLSKQATLIKPQILDSIFLKNLAHIDGAILIDPNCYCYAIGVILDGIASQNGNSSRGSRYNSAIKYIDMNLENSLAIIISDDGIIDIYPKFK